MTVAELVGCSGSGKTTLARVVAAKDTRMHVATDRVLDRPVLRRITSPTGANVVQEVAGLPSFLRACPQHASFLEFSFAMIVRHAPSRLDAVLNCRSLVRRLGMHELAARRPGNDIVLLDEGILQSVYHLFIYSTADLRQRDVERFAELVPLPHHIVHVRSQTQHLLARAVSRPDRRRQMQHADDQQLRAGLRRAACVFGRLLDHPRLRPRVIVVDNDDAGSVMDMAVARLAEQLLSTPRSGGALATSSVLP